MPLLKLTDYTGLPVRVKNFAWSISKLKDFDTCPLKGWAQSFAPEPYRTVYVETDAKRRGNQIHQAFEMAVKDGSYQLPLEYQHLQRWLDHLAVLPGQHRAEWKYAFTREWTPVAWDRWNQVWVRMALDFTAFDVHHAIIVDYKDGKSKNVKDDLQLKLNALAAFTESAIDRVYAGFWFWNENKVIKQEYDRREANSFKVAFEEMVKPLEDAFHTGTFPPKKNGLCKEWCPNSFCPHWGGGAKCSQNILIQE